MEKAADNLVIVGNLDGVEFQDGLDFQAIQVQVSLAIVAYQDGVGYPVGQAFRAIADQEYRVIVVLV